MTEKPKFVYVTYIAAAPEKVWDALTKPDISEKYWFGYRLAAAGRAGDMMTATSPAGKLSHRDPIIESEPRRRLVYGWKPLEIGKPDERPSRVTFELEPFRGQTRLTVIHDEFDEGSKIFGMISKGWPAVLSSLKSFLETGHPLDPSWMDQAQSCAAEADA